MSIFIKSFIFVFFLFFSSPFLFSQTSVVKVEVTDSKLKPLTGMSVVLYPVVDSLQKQIVNSDSFGVATFTIDSLQLYKLIVFGVGFQRAEKSFRFNKSKQTKFILKEQFNELTAVVVTASKPLLKQEEDKTIVDPEPLAASSTNAFETMEKIPGVFIDQDGNIYLNGLSPAGVQINGRDMRMSAADLATLLKSLPPSVIQKIELVRTPSAKYDASGGGGVVNIILKKGVKLGLNGSLNTGLAQGIYGNQFIGLNLTNTNDRLSTYVNSQYNENNGYNVVNTDRFFSTDTVLKQKARTQSPNRSLYIGFGLSKNWTEKWELSYDGRFTQQNFKNSTDNLSLFEIISRSQVLNRIESEVINDGTNFNTNQSIRSKLKLDSTGGEWIIDISYTLARANTHQNYQNTFSNITFNNKGFGSFTNDRDFFIYQTDYKKKWIGIVFETGLKSSNLLFNNNAAYFKIASNKTVKDDFRTSAYQFKEQINAAYFQGAKTWGPVILKIGSRIEQTVMQGRQQLPADTTFNVNRTDAFPYVYLSRKIMTIAGYELRGFLVYRKTISRPSYEYLNPFPKYVDPFLYETGNPSLRPQFTSNYEANISVDDKPLFAFGVNETKDIFTNVIYQSPTNKQLAYRTYDNLGKSKETYFRAIAAIPPGKTFFAVIGTQYNRNVYNGFYENKPIEFDKGTWTFFTFQSLKLGKLSTATLNGFWRTNGQQQFYELENFGQLNASVNRQFLNKKLVVTFSMNDIFFTNNNKFILKQGSIYATGYRENDTRRWGLNIRYNFGFKPKENKMEMLELNENDK